jgi:hypothetical protein
MRVRYWSCSKFANWVRGTDKPAAATSSEWKLWRKISKETYPIRYWIAEELLDNIQDVINWPTDKLKNARYYINNRWVNRTHALTAHPRDIKPGEWCDVGNRFLPCLFNELVDFVEIEQAWHHCMWDEAARKQFQVPWWRKGWLRWRSWRCPEAGLSYLDWASQLVNDQGNPTHQALAAQEIKELYVWWKEVYSARPDIYDAGGWTAYCNMQRNQGFDILDTNDRTPEDAEMKRSALDRCCALEAAYEKEDEEMMIRLIRVRNSLWT